MCYYTQQGKSAAELTDYYNRNIDHHENVLQSDFINGFGYPNIPIILDEKPDLITTNFTWGLIPENRDKDFRKHALNARVETLEEKAAFASSINKRCLVIATGYYDWHWNDPAGKSKTKHIIYSTQAEAFCMAGIYCSWQDKSGETWNTYSIVTTEPNETMKYVHNRKAEDNDERMPIMINPGDEHLWLDHKNHPLDFAYPSYKPGLISFTV